MGWWMLRRGFREFCFLVTFRRGLLLIGGDTGSRLISLDERGGMRMC